ncbi:nuclear transport factor 2 family protein [Propioniciclava sp.]|uniref:nuclear transport factor 2 family protein n=1 Tax=Propioniciclava sp. TaxID=2038686 RepID=UPI002627AF98|nr:nuclear transport factor 2 family protein [Propioniciclava sp.]
MTSDADAAGVRSAYGRYLAAMRAGDRAALDALLADDSTLTHISGYEQPKAGWLAEMGQGQFVYHSVDEAGEPVIDVAGDMATLRGRIVTDASVYGGRNRWRLAFVQTWRRTGDRWLLAGAVAHTW